MVPCCCSRDVVCLCMCRAAFHFLLKHPPQLHPHLHASSLQPTCAPSTIAASLVALASCFFAFMLLYFLLYAFAITRAFNSLLKLPYNLHRNANLVVRMQVRLEAVQFSICACVP